MAVPQTKPLGKGMAAGFNFGRKSAGLGFHEEIRTEGWLIQ